VKQLVAEVCGCTANCDGYGGDQSEDVLEFTEILKQVPSKMMRIATIAAILFLIANLSRPNEALVSKGPSRRDRTLHWLHDAAVEGLEVRRASLCDLWC
jgi:hypothetical protein